MNDICKTCPIAKNEYASTDGPLELPGQLPRTDPETSEAFSALLDLVTSDSESKEDFIQRVRAVLDTTPIRQSQLRKDHEKLTAEHTAALARIEVLEHERDALARQRDGLQDDLRKYQAAAADLFADTTSGFFDPLDAPQRTESLNVQHMIPVEERMPGNPLCDDRVPPYVLGYSETHDWMGCPFAILRSSDFHELNPDEPDEIGTDDAQVVTRWTYLP